MKNKNLKRLLAGALACALVVGAIAGGMVIYRNATKGAVEVYSVANCAMTDYWGDSSSCEGTVTTEGIQQVYISETQTVTEVYVTEGQTVKAGDPILAYDTTLSSLDVKRAELAVQKQELELANEKKELEKIKAMKPSSGYSGGGSGGSSGGGSSTIVTPTEKTGTDYTEPYYVKGNGTMSDPYIFDVPDDWTWDQAMLRKFYTGEAAVIAPKEDDSEEPSTEEPSSEEPSSEEPSSEEPTSEEPSSEDEQIEGESDTEPEESTQTASRSNPRVNASGMTKRTASGTPVYVVLVFRDGDNTAGDITSSAGLCLAVEQNEVLFTFFTPDLSSLTEEDGSDYSDDYTDWGSDDSYYSDDSGYTSAEIAQMRNEKEIAIRDLELQIKIAKVDLEKKQKEFNDGKVYAEMDGDVTAVRDADEAYQDGKPVVEVSAGGGFYVEGSLSELELGSVNVGDSVDISSWESGAYCCGTITEVSDIPTENAYNWSSGNSNVSYYPFTVFVEADAGLQEGEWVEMQYSAQAADSSDAWYLDSMYIRTENGESYVYVMNDAGRLEKRTVITGKSVWGSYTEIRSGITMDDYIAFPYGDAAEGAKAQIVDVDYGYGY